MNKTMTRIRMSIVKSFLALFIITIAFSCNTSNEEINPAADVPELLERSEKIRAGKEWDTSQNFYSAQLKSLQQDPNNSQAKLNLAQLYIKEARITGEHGHYYPAALKMCEEVLIAEELTEDMRFRTLMTKAGVQLSLHEFASALETGKMAMAINDKNAQIHGVLVDAYVELGEYEKAIEMADKMINIKPDLRSYSRISYLREIHGDVEGAKAAMKLAVDAGYPGYDETAWTMITLGDLYKQYGEPEKAKQIYEAILAERVDYPFAIAAIADVHYQMGELEIAEAKLKEAMDIIPEVGYYTQYAHILKDQKRDEEFEEIMEEVFLMLEDDVQSGHNMNLEYVSIYRDLLDNPEKALEYAKMEYEKRPKNIDVNRAMASVYLAIDKKEEAKMHVVLAARTASKNPELLKLQKEI